MAALLAKTAPATFAAPFPSPLDEVVVVVVVVELVVTTGDVSVVVV